MVFLLMEIVDDDINCGAFGELAPSDQPQCYISWNPTCAEVLAALGNIEDDIEEIQALDIPDDFKQARIQSLLRCRRLLFLKKLRLCGPVSEPLPKEYDNFEMKTKILGLLINQGELDHATTLLQGINPASEEEQDFVTTQWINLRYKRDEANFAIQLPEEQHLQIASMKRNSLAAYSRSLYYIITGKELYPPLLLASAKTNPRSVKESIDIQVFPSIAHDNLLINSTNKTPEGVLTIVAWSPTGSLITSTSTTNQQPT